MSTFDSSSMKTGGLNVDSTVSYVNSLAGLFPGVATYTPGSPMSSTTSSWITTATKTATFASDESIFISGLLYFSCGTSATQGRMAIFVNGSPLGGDFSIACAATGTGGNADFRNLVKISPPVGGSVTIDLKFSYNTGGGTVYVSYAELYVEGRKYRPS